MQTIFVQSESDSFMWEAPLQERVINEMSNRVAEVQFYSNVTH